MASDVSAILRLEVPVIVRLGERVMSLDEVLDLVPGAIIELPKNAEEPLDLLVNNKQIGQGTAVKVGENFGIRIDHIGDRKDRIAALTAPDGAGTSAGDPAPGADGVVAGAAFEPAAAASPTG